MDKQEYINIFKGQKPVKELCKLYSEKRLDTFLIKGLYSSSKSFAISAASVEGINIVILNNRQDAEYCTSDLYRIDNEDDILFFPASKDVNRRYNISDSSSLVQRTHTLNRINSFLSDNGERAKLIIVTYPQAVEELIIEQSKFIDSILKISKGDELSHEFIKEILFEYGFCKSDYVSEPGQFALRGGIIDIFSFSDNRPYRVDFFGDTVENIKIFDIDSQRSVQEVNSVDILPNITDRLSESTITIFDFCQNKSTLWISDVDYLLGKFDKTFFNNIISSHKTFLFSPVIENSSIYSKIVEFDTAPQPLFNKNFSLLAEDIKLNISRGYKVSILTESASQTERIAAILSEFSKSGKLDYTIEPISIHEGFVDNISKWCLYTDHQIFDRHRRVKLFKSVEKSEKLTINELNAYEIGDYIVHIDHGVGQFGGLVKTNLNGKEQEAVKLIYKDGDVIFVSVHALHRIAKYRSKDAESPKIYKLGTGAWQKIKSQTKAKVKDIAKDLIDLYSKRKDVKGFAFSPDSFLQHELEASFMYEDTPDQYKSITAVKADMEQEYPMDRLVCGDVGFGKTEIAIRASFKAVADNKQVAVLVPTTILSLQHYRSFSKRLKEFPCKIEYISRLKSPKEIREISDKLKSGEIDIIIGTHRLLNKEIEFKDLGLLVIDEEQKFGVAAKERLKQIKLNVDTLTLSATPIPRTLQFSLLGARDLSIISTPPPNRQPISTHLIDLDWEFIKEVINQEIERGGQIFFVHNRVEDIKAIEDTIKSIIPTIKSCVAHGQMAPADLEKRILDFILGDYDILIATTIVENGIDIPNANTIIINNAQNFGLSDLHQLRGRVGRSNVKAYCYLITPPVSNLKDDARRRLKAIETFSDLGSGFNIAMQDLDIRGAGNLLGAEQSGFIADMGFETYQRILEEAFIEIKHEKGFDEDNKESYVSDCVIDTDLEILIPDSYISITAEKIRLYKDLDSISSEEKLEQFREELEDRYGKLPKQVEQLMFVVKLRWLGIELGFEKIVLKGSKMLAYFVSDQKSSYYSGNKFASILNYIQKESKIFRIKEQNNKLLISADNVKSAENAYNIFFKMKL